MSVKTGWQCPGCGKCYAPAVLECTRCPIIEHRYLTPLEQAVATAITPACPSLGCSKPAGHPGPCPNSC